jgi:exosome complex component RRP4
LLNVISEAQGKHVKVRFMNEKRGRDRKSGSGPRDRKPFKKSSGPRGRGKKGDGRPRKSGPRDRHDRRRGGRPRRDRRDGGRPRQRPRRPTSKRIDIPREVVLPGDLLSEENIKPGMGTFKRDGKIFASQLGIKALYADMVVVIPLSGKYMPMRGDEVIGKIVDLLPMGWLVDINAPYPAPLHGEDSPWEVDFGDARKYMTLGDIVLVEVSQVDLIKRIRVEMRKPGLRKLSGGHIMEISPSKIPRVIGKGGSMIKMLKERAGCRIHVGQNGRIWIDGEPESIQKTVTALELIEREAHMLGLTEKIGKLLDELFGAEKKPFGKPPGAGSDEIEGPVEGTENQTERKEE